MNHADMEHLAKDIYTELDFCISDQDHISTILGGLTTVRDRVFEEAKEPKKVRMLTLLEIRDLVIKARESGLDALLKELHTLIGNEVID